MNKCVGFKKFTSKEGKRFCIVNYTTDYSDNEKQYGAFGEKTCEVWINKPELQEKVTDKLIGKNFDIIYMLNGSYKEPCDIVIK